MPRQKKLQIGIYKIDTEDELLFQDGNPLDIISKKIREKDGDFTIQELQQDIKNGFKIQVLYKKRLSNPQWKIFLSDIVKNNQDVFQINKNYAESFIMLCFNNNSNNLYAITGGLGYHVIQEFINDDFGVNILSRLIKKEDKILKSVKEKSVTGGILGSTKYFRKKYNLLENDSFGKIYQELKVDLDKDILNKHFGFSDEDSRKEASCIAKTSFKINKSITFRQLINIISGCEYVLENLDAISINNVKKIQRKKNKFLIQNLESQLFNELWKRYKNEDSFNFDLCHRDFEKYLTASKYIIKKNTSSNNYFNNVEFQRLESINKLFEEIKKREDRPKNKKGFEKLIRSLKIYSYNEEDENNELTKGLIIHHIFGDVTSLEDNRKYFLIDNNWYLIKKDFIRQLNDNCKLFIVNNFENGLEKKWDYRNDNKEKRSENFYNKSYIGEDRTIVLDKIIPENIEPCDILKWDSDNLYLYYVKASFGNTMRDLCSQIFIAANRIKNDLNSSKEYIGKIYDQLQAKIDSDDAYYSEIGKQTKIISRDIFIELFSDKKLIFVLSVLDTKPDERSIKTDIKKFRSNIAKFSLQELVQAMKGIDVEFKITQIFKN